MYWAAENYVVPAVPARCAPKSEQRAMPDKAVDASTATVVQPIASDAGEQDRRKAAIDAAASDVVRCCAILTSPESSGRQRLANHFAYETAETVAAARAAMAVAGLEPGSKPALELEAKALAKSILEAGRVRTAKSDT